MNRILFALASAGIAIGLVSCGSKNNTSSSGTGGTSLLSNRAFVTNSLQSTTFPASVFVVNASKDLFTRFAFNAGRQPGLIVLNPSHNLSLIASTGDNNITLVDNTNTKERAIAQIGLSVGAASSMVFSADSTIAYVAVPDALVLNGSNGVILILDIDQSTRKYTVASRIPFAGANQLQINSTGDRVLAFGDSNTLAVIDTTKVSLAVADNTPATTFIAGFDRVVDGVFSTDGNTAYVFSCGAECGGTQASVSTVDMTALHTNATLALDGATAGYLSGSTLYVAGSKPGTPCTSTTAAANCGSLTQVDTGSLTIKQAAIEVTDGFHNHFEIQKGKLFLGAKRCSNVNTSAETRGCLSIVDTTANKAVVSPDLGDVTGIAPIGGGRSEVYVIIGNELRIYDANTSALIDSTKQLDIVGAPVDVKYVDK